MHPSLKSSGGTSWVPKGPAGQSPAWNPSCDMNDNVLYIFGVSGEMKTGKPFSLLGRLVISFAFILNTLPDLAYLSNCRAGGGI